MYPAPFNLIETFILPLEWVLSRENYAKLNRWLMSFLFCIPLCVVHLSLSLCFDTCRTGFQKIWLTPGRAQNRCVIALFESHLDRKRAEDFQNLLEEPDEYKEPEEDPAPWHGENDNGEPDEFGDVEDEGKEIARVKFEDLKKKMPNLTRSVSGEILWQVSRAETSFFSLLLLQSTPAQFLYASTLELTPFPCSVQQVAELKKQIEEMKELVASAKK